MQSNSHTEPAIMTVFGAGGDLAQRKLVPALFNLFLDGWLPEQFRIVGLDRTPMDVQAFRQHLREGVDRFSRRGKAKDQDWDRFSSHLAYLVADFADQEAFSLLSDRIAACEKEWGQPADRIFYLATPPTMMELIAQQLHRAGLSDDRERVRIVFEKPFGRDLESACKLNDVLTSFFAETQIYRIDHYLGKETVQNILAFRFANALFEPIWDQRYIDHVQITVAEEVGVGHRGGYYDQAGALRDMIQNHLLQILCLVAMEPPVSFGADEIRNKKVDVLRAIRPIPTKDVMDQFAVRGQYGEGQIDGRHVPAYRHENDVSSTSNTETYAALKLFIDNWRWQNVPFYLRTGKCLPARISEVSVVFRPVPHQSFPKPALEGWETNRLVIQIQPNEGIAMCVQAKRPGLEVRLDSVAMEFCYQEVFQTPSPEAYETLLLDVLQGDATLFMRADQIEAAWSVVTPVLEAWAAKAPVGFPNYPAGSWGPEAADRLLTGDERHWLAPMADVE